MNNIYEQFSVEELANSKIPNLVFVYHFLHVNKVSTDMKYWEKCADVLIYRGHERIKDVELLMLNWLQDLNWSGSIKVFKYFMEIDVKDLNELLMDSFQLAYIQHDIDWAINLWNLILNRKDGNIIAKNVQENANLSKFIEEILNEQ